MNLFDKKKGLFAMEYYKDWLPRYMMEIFDVKYRWIEIVEWNELKVLVKDRPKLHDKIKVKFANTADIKARISALIGFIKRTKMSSLKCLHDIKPSQFRDELLLFIGDALCKYVQFRDIGGGISEEELMHKVLFERTTHDTCRRMKVLVDVAWHWQPYEEYAETVAKIVGIKYNEMSRRMTFENLRKAVLDSMWLPSLKDQHNLVRDVVNRAIVDGKRCCKVDHRSSRGIKSFETMERESEEGAMPYK